MKYWNATFLERLLQVQSTDLKIRKLDAKIQVYYQRSKEEDAELTRLKSEISGVDDNIASTESQNQMYSTTLDDIRTAIKGLLTTKSGVPKPRTRSSTEALKIEEEKLATLVDETTAQLARLRIDRNVLIDRATARSRTLEKSQEGPEAEIRKLQTQIRRLEKQREEEINGLPPMLLKHYDRLRSSRSGIGLTILRDGVCTVCRMQMPTAVISRMNKGERVPVCPACGRMVARIEIINLIPKDDSAAGAVGTADKKKRATKATKVKKKTAPAAKSKAVGGAAVAENVGDVAKAKPAAKKATKKTAKKAAAAETKVATAKKVTKKSTAKKIEEKKTGAKKVAAAKTPTKKEAAKKETAKKKKAEPRKGTKKNNTPQKAAKPSGTKKTQVKKAAKEKSVAKKIPAKKSAKKSAAKKPAAKKK